MATETGAATGTKVARASRLAPQLAGGIATAGALAFLAVLALIQFTVKPSATDTYVSDMANGPRGALFGIAALAHGTANLALAWAIWKRVGPARLGAWGSGLIALAALGIVVAAIFRTDPPGSAATRAGSIHLAAASISFILEPVALLLLARSAPAGRWTRFTTTAALVAMLGLVALVWQLYEGDVPGAPERIVLVTLAVWEAATGVWILRTRSFP